MRPDQLIKDGRKTTCTIRHRTIDDVERCMRLAKQAADNQDWRSSVNGNARFTGTKSIEAYADMLRDGWAHGVEDVEGLEGLSTDASDKVQFQRNVAGAFPVVPAYLAGHPASMLQPYTAPADSQRGLTLVIDTCFSAYVECDTALAYARTVMRMVAWLQAEQIETAVYSVVPMMLGRSRNKRVL
jgi:hypothetical protein